MIDENMVERVARAIFESHNASYQAIRWENDPDHWRRYARAAIEAMNLDTIPIADINDIDRVD